MQTSDFREWVSRMDPSGWSGDGTSTGTKCLPTSVIPAANGLMLHDSHAEILALRGLNAFILADLQNILSLPSQSSAFLHSNPDPRSDARPFVLNSSLSIHLFVTSPPCGDASMEFLISSRPSEDAQPWTNPTSNLQGRGYFSDLGVVRRKPARGDAEQTLSKSCSDKLAVRQVTGLWNTIVSIFVEPAWLTSLVLPTEEGIVEGCRRAFGVTGRLKNLSMAPLPRRFTYQPFKIDLLPREFKRFEFSRNEDNVRKAGNVSAVWFAGLNGYGIGMSETIINGVKEGHAQHSVDQRKGSVLCRKRFWERAQKATELRGLSEPNGIEKETFAMLKSCTYASLKGHPINADRREAKASIVGVLGPWRKNSGDDGWCLSSHKKNHVTTP
ncbi:MAG: hypothetical protein Q9227_001155 [Pyrenula ochraceoflavens]